MRRPRPIKRTWKKIEDKSATATRISTGAHWLNMVILGISAFLFVAVLLFVGTRLLFKTATIPKTAIGVLQSAQDPQRYGYEIQTIKKYKILNQDFERQSVTLLNVDLNAGKFEGKLFGMSEDPVEIGYDTKTSAYRALQSKNEPVGIVDTNAMTAYEGPSIRAVLPPSTKDVIRSKPTIDSDTASYRKLQAWRINFKPDSILLDKLFPSSKFPIGESAKQLDDLDKINAGKYKVDEAYVLVTRESRQMLLMTIRIRLSNDHGYRFLVKYSNFNRVDLKDYKLEEK